MTSKTLLAVALCCLAVAVHEVSASKCYECNPLFTSACNDPFDSTSIDTCNSPACYKATYTYTLNKTRTTISFRGCTDNNQKDGCDSYTDDTYGTGTMCFCHGGLCNSALNLAASFSFMLLAVISALMLIRRSV